MTDKFIRIAWLATHPNQYQAPLLREISKLKNVRLKVIFFSDFSVNGYRDIEMNKIVNWDIPLLEGYEYQFLSHASSQFKSLTFINPRISKLRDFLTNEKFDLLVIQGWNHYGYIYGAIIAWMNGIRVLLRSEATDHFKLSFGLKSILRQVILKSLFRLVDCFGVIGKNNLQFYLNHGINKAKMVNMPYCVDNDFFQEKITESEEVELREELNLNEPKSILLYVGKLTLRKNAHVLLEGYRLLPEPRPYLLIVGDGELRPILELLIKKGSLSSSVRLIGFCNQSKLPKLYKISDVFILPSVKETWGLVVNEAMNAGCAILVNREVGSAEDLVINGKNGFIINGVTPNNIKNSIELILENESYKEMGANSLEIIKKYSIDQNIKGLIEGLKVMGL